MSTGIFNTAVGTGTLAFNTSGLHNTAIGAESSAFSTTGKENTTVGYRSGYALIGGDQNSFLGWGAGNTVTTGNNNIAIGYQAQVPTAAGINQLSIGNWIYGSAGDIGIGVPVPLAKLHVAGKIQAVDVNFSGLPIYADEAAAIVGGIAFGDLYRTGTGEIRIKL